MRETHLIVLWEFARAEETRILEDVRTRFTVLHDAVISWPDDPLACFRRFYGANLPDADGKVKLCGGGPFRMLIVSDEHPAYALRETSRGLERVNLNLFDAKIRYREWTGGGHKVHTTNSVTEAEHDIFLLTGHPAADWANGRPAGDLTVLPGQGGWKSLRELFSVLGRFAPYAVLRNAETLPDAFDPSLHGDIDLLVENAETTAGLLGARKVFPERHRVHYELVVGGRPVRFDFRFVGDGYYDAAWERRMLERRIARDGVNLLHPEDAFFALVYHALYQKFEIAGDYIAKAEALARAAGLPWTDYADALVRLEDFLAHNGYEKTRPDDTSVRWNERLVDWRKLADEMASLSGATDIRPVRLEAIRAETPLRTSFYSGRLNGRMCFIKYSPYAKFLTAAEWRYPHLLAAGGAGETFEKSLHWHTTSDGGAFVITEWIDGTGLDALIARKDPLLAEKADVIAADFVRIAEALEHAKVVHRDIRPANLMVDADGHVKLIDFQFAAPFGTTPEDPWVDACPAVLDGLGAEYALAHGKWNDRQSLRKSLSELPPSSARDKGLAALEPGSGKPTREACCSPGRMAWIIRRRNRLRRMKLATLLSRRKRAAFINHYGAELEFLDRARSWKVVG